MRLEFPGALWHVTNRGVEQRSIYTDDRDRNRFLQLLEKVVDDYRWQLLAYVLMSNHYHLLFRTPETTLSLGIKDVNGEYASYFNDRYKRVGHLFQGRFKSQLVDSETYFVEVARYIVLNPVRAGMVTRPDDWKWSSYRATAGLAAVPRWLDPQPILDAFHPEDWNIAVQEYREFVTGVRSQVKVTKIVRPSIRHSSSVTFTFDLTPIKEAVEGVGAGADERALMALLASRHTHASRAAIGRLLGITGCGALHLIRLAEERAKRDPAFALLVRSAEARVEGR